MDKENQINDKLKIMKFSLLPCGLKHTVFISNAVVFKVNIILIVYKKYFYLLKLNKSFTEDI